MNAKALTLLFSASVLVLGNLVVAPGYAAYKKGGTALKRAEQSADAAKAWVSTVAALEDKEVNLQEPSVGLSTAVSGWMSAQEQYGVRITQISAQLPPSGQSTVQMVALVEPDPVTKLPIQRLKVKGQYTSIVAFENYLASEFGIKKAIRIDSLNMQGESFEVGASIFGKAD